MIRFCLLLLAIGSTHILAQVPTWLDVSKAEEILSENVSFEKDPESSSIAAVFSIDGVNNICNTGVDLLQVIAGTGVFNCALRNSHIRQIPRDSGLHFGHDGAMFDYRDGLPSKILERLNRSADPNLGADVMVHAYECNGDTNTFLFKQPVEYCLRGPTFSEDAFTIDLVGDEWPDLVVRSRNDSIWYNIVPNGSEIPHSCDQTIYVPAVPGRTIVSETVTDNGLVVVARDTGSGPNNRLYAMELSVTTFSPDSIVFSWRDFSSVSISCDSCEQPKKWYVGKDGNNGDVYVYRSFKDNKGEYALLVDRLSKRRLERITHLTGASLWMHGTMPESHMLGVPIVMFHLNESSSNYGDPMYFSRLDNISQPFGYILQEVSVTRLEQFRVIRDGNGDNKPDVLQAQFVNVSVPFNLLDIYERFQLAGPTGVHEFTNSRTNGIKMRGSTLILDGDPRPSDVEIYDGVGSIESRFSVVGGTHFVDLEPFIVNKASGLRIVVRHLPDAVQTVSYVYTR